MYTRNHFTKGFNMKCTRQSCEEKWKYQYKIVNGTGLWGENAIYIVSECLDDV